MLHVRHVTRNDRATWLHMRHALWPEGSASEHQAEIEAFFAGRLRDPRAVLVAEEHGDVLGFAELSVRPYAEDCETDRVAYLEGWYVAPDARRRGVGRALVAGAEAWAAGLGCREFASDAVLDNRESALAHRALGFEETVRIRCFRKIVSVSGASAPAPVVRAVPGSAVVIRDASISDAESLGRVVTELGYTTSPDQMRGRLASILPRPEYLTLVALIEGRTAGFLGAMVCPLYETDAPCGQILALAVDPPHQRRGVGRMLVGTVEKMLVQRGAGLVVVNTGTHRLDAHAFYEACGYSFTGRRYRKTLP